MYDTAFYPEETGHLYADLRLHLASGRELQCDTVYYADGPAARPGGVSSNLECARWAYADSPVDTPLRPTPAEVYSAVYGYGSSLNTVVVAGVQRPTQPAVPTPSP